MTQAQEQMVRECAYYIWIDSGMTHGMAHDHWIAAERSLAVASTAPKAMPAVASKATKKKVAMPAEKTGKVQSAAKVEAMPAKAAKLASTPVATPQAAAKRPVKSTAKGSLSTHGATTH